MNAENRITTQAAAEVPSIYYMDGDRKRASAMILVLGVVLDDVRRVLVRTPRAAGSAKERS